MYTPDRQINPPEPIECDNCNGTGIEENTSDCCEAYMDSDIKICSKCKDHAEAMPCMECDGTGTKPF